MRLPLAALAIAVLAGTAFAQSAPLALEAAHARQLLDSPQLTDKAWGAYLAGRLHTEEMNAKLLDQLGAAAALAGAPRGSAEHAFVAVLFDAAIEADIEVPTATLEPFEQYWIDAVMILLARSGNNEDALLRIADSSGGMVWLAANNLLFGMKSPRWFARTLSRVTVTHRILVTDPNSGAGSGGGVSEGCCGPGVDTIPRGFPPTTLYTLHQRPQRGSVLLAPGPKDVYYAGTTVTPDKPASSGCEPAIDENAMRTAYLAEMAHWPDSAAGLFHAISSVCYRTVEAYQREAAMTLNRQENGLRRLMRAISENGMPIPPGTTLRIVPEVDDQRQTRAAPLPAIPPRDIVWN